MSRTNRAEWLAGLRPAVQDWVGRQCHRLQQFCAKLGPAADRDSVPADAACTRTYADLTLAYGLAWLGRPAEECHSLVDEARRRLEPWWDEAHALLFGAYEYRVGQALERAPGFGSLPAALLDRLDARPSACGRRLAGHRPGGAGAARLR